MRSLVYSGGGSFAWQERPAPALAEDTDALVRPVAVATCDLDVAIGQGLLDGLGTGFPVGHEIVGEVLQTGPQVELLTPGDRVVVAFQVSCGDCRACRTGRSAVCTTVGTQRLYGLPIGGNRWGGGFDDVVVVPWADRNALPVPAGVGPAVAAVGDNASDAWRTVVPYLDEFEGPVLVDGFASIGLYAVAYAAAAGVEVHYRDTDDQQLGLAAALGAEVLRMPPSASTADRYVLTVSTAPTVEGLTGSIAATRSGGRCVTTGMHLRDTTPLPLFDMYLRSLRFVNETVQMGDVMAAALADAESLDLDHHVTTAPWDEAPAMLARPHPKLLFVR